MQKTTVIITSEETKATLDGMCISAVILVISSVQRFMHHHKLSVNFLFKTGL